MTAFRVVILCMLVGCSKSPVPSPGSATPAEPGAVRVKVSAPKRQPLNWAIELPATVEPFEVTAIIAKFPAHVKSVAVDERAPRTAGKPTPLIDIGSEVEVGQLLATLHIPELDAEAGEKAAAVDRTKAEETQTVKELAVAGEQVAVADAMVKEAAAGSLRADADVNRWKAEFDQVATQIAGGIADTQTRNVVTKNWDSAKAAKLEAEAKVATAKVMVSERKARQSRAEADVAAAGTRVKVAEAEAARVEALRTYLKVTAPFSGIVTARGRVDTQTFVNATSGPLFTVARIDVLRVFADVPEVSASKAGPGVTAVVRVPSQAGREYVGKVARTAGVTNPETRTRRVEIDIENTDRTLAPGAYATVRIDATATDATVIPAACILAADETHSIFIVEAGKAVKYRVQIGRSDGPNTQVLGRRKATLTTGTWQAFGGTEQVINGNLGALADGTAVTVAE